MAILGIDIGGTKIAFGVFSERGDLIFREKILIEGRGGDDVGSLITGTISLIHNRLRESGDQLRSVGISVPGIYRQASQTVWAPNIKGWDDYPLAEKIKESTGSIPVIIDNDRACSLMGEMWMGNARGCKNIVFIVVGTGIGAGILVNGEILRGKSDIAGASGWMALKPPYEDKYRDCGCFEYYASGAGIVRTAMETALEYKYYHGDLAVSDNSKLTARDIFTANDEGDPVAQRVIDKCIVLWGMAVANFISIFNPEKIILGGGIFGPGEKYLPQIRSEAARWAQPISFGETEIIISALKSDAVLYGAGYLALRNYLSISKTPE